VNAFIKMYQCKNLEIVVWLFMAKCDSNHVRMMRVSLEKRYFFVWEVDMVGDFLYQLAASYKLSPCDNRSSLVIDHWCWRGFRFS